MTEEFKYQVTKNSNWVFEEWIERKCWLAQNIDDYLWDNGEVIYFRNEEDAIIFKLRFKV